MTFNVNLLLCRQSYACYGLTAEARTIGFRYKVALYVIYLHIKFDYEIKRNPFKFKA